MPQLRSSSANGPVPASETNGYDRIFGVETEYGVSVTGATGPVEAGEVAMAMFRPVVSRSRSTNTYLTNGSRLYLDVGSHPEYATAEARDPLDALAQDLAGERTMARLAAGAEATLKGRFGAGVRVHVFKNNVDSAGHSFGCHENYLVRRAVPLPMIEAQLLPFLITRQLFTGAGRVTPEGFQITQRADFLDEAISSATTRSRPMVNTRDEPHADPEAFRRLHVIIGDSNRSQWATWMKLATTHLVLALIEDAVRRGESSGLEGLALADPAASNRAVSRLLDAPDALLTLTEGGSMRALDMQRRYLAAVERFLASHEGSDKGSDGTGLSGHPDSALGLTRTSPADVVDQWRAALDALEAGDWDSLANRVDWAAKRRLLAGLKARRPDLTAAQAERIELDYHDIASGHAYASLLTHGQMTALTDDSEAERASNEPPADTRAALRGTFVRRALDAGAQFSCDWTTLTLATPVRATATLLDPFAAAPTDEFTRLMAAL